MGGENYTKGLYRVYLNVSWYTKKNETKYDDKMDFKNQRVYWKIQDIWQKKNLI